ncbi:beta-ketoacyl-[acyl-carrier-protein] synthase II [Actinomadura sp. GC306]|uniref:beta-ketoacyl-ACP synthase II n=1 Tax=Actinomadura sp. GC306 TaxID=2530367 RepID=UPI0010465459|nr:beta-ketoacyl-ACP synthase II [Actinomadura sp. GC306]TDC70295.1 beta-ketoacyl-[acyl-carrier-protein] synthase II [Actinomadura sp. GC306]
MSTHSEAPRPGAPGSDRTAPRRRVVVTGTGAVSPIGVTADEFWAGLLAGRSGAHPITGFDAAELPVRIAAEVRDFDPDVYLERKLSRRLDGYAQYAIAAAYQATAQAKLPVGDGAGDGTAVYVGSAYGADKLMTIALNTMRERGYRAMSPFYAANSGVDSAAGEIAMLLGATGPSNSMSTACATGATCIGEATRLIRHGYADVAVAGAADDCVTPLNISTTARAGALTRRNDDPERASRPFDRDRDGFLMGAGAGVVVLESAEHALARDAEILAELAGYGSSTDAYHVTAPHPEGRGARTAIRQAMQDAGLAPADVDYVNAHGTGTVMNDRVEAAAIRAELGEHAERIPISSIKSMTGHTLGAAGALELIASIRTIREGVIPPTINCDDPEDAGLDFVPHEARRQEVRTVLSNSFGFGGRNAVLAVTRWEA